jgi:hypothetical protein
VNSVNLNANDLVASGNQFNKPPADGTVYVMANVTTTYNGDEASDKTGVQFQAVGASSNKVLDAGGSSYPVPPDQYQQLTEVFKGGSLTGNMVFEVPTADVDSLVLIGHALLSFNDKDRAFFATK